MVTHSVTAACHAVDAVRTTSDKRPIKTWSRRSTILPDFGYKEIDEDLARALIKQAKTAGRRGHGGRETPLAAQHQSLHQIYKLFANKKL